MNDLIRLIKTTVQEHPHLPFAVYSSLKEQRIFNVPIIKPVLIVVLDGEKRLGKTSDIICTTGEFYFFIQQPHARYAQYPQRARILCTVD